MGIGEIEEREFIILIGLADEMKKTAIAHRRCSSWTSKMIADDSRYPLKKYMNKSDERIKNKPTSFPVNNKKTLALWSTSYPTRNTNQRRKGQNRSHLAQITRQKKTTKKVAVPSSPSEIRKIRGSYTKISHTFEIIYSKCGKPKLLCTAFLDVMPWRLAVFYWLLDK